MRKTVTKTNGMTVGKQCVRTEQTEKAELHTPWLAAPFSTIHEAPIFFFSPPPCRSTVLLSCPRYTGSPREICSPNEQAIVFHSYSHLTNTSKRPFLAHVGCVFYRSTHVAAAASSRTYFKEVLKTRNDNCRVSKLVSHTERVSHRTRCPQSRKALDAPQSNKPMCARSPYHSTLSQLSPWLPAPGVWWDPASSSRPRLPFRSTGRTPSSPCLDAHISPK